MPKRSLPEQLQQIIQRDLGLITELPESVNRGHWGKYDDAEITRWMAKTVDGRLTLESPNSMQACVKCGVSLFQPGYRSTCEPLVYAKQD